MYQKTFKCYQIFSNLNKLKIQILCLFCLFTIVSVSSQQQIQTDSKEIFTNEFFSNKRVHHILKERVQKKEIFILDKNSIITNKLLSYSNDEIAITIDNSLHEADLSVQYYIINPDLAYVVLFKDTNEGISFIFVKTKNPDKWNFFEYSIRETR